MKKVICIIFIYLFSLLLVTLSFAQTSKSKINNPAEEFGYFSSENWCNDQTTIPFGESAKHRPYLSGLRIIFEPQFGTLFQMGDDRIIAKNFKDLPKFGLETNLYKGWIAMQIGLIYPSTIQFDSKSKIVKNKLLEDGGDNANIDIGLTIGLSFLDGVFAVGFGQVTYDKRDFIDFYTGYYYNTFGYFNVQPASLVKGLIKNLKK